MTGSAAVTSRPRLVDTANFLLATRDSGYRSTAYAVAEFVDNSLQAGATSVAIDLLAGDEKTFPIDLEAAVRFAIGRREQTAVPVERHCLDGCISCVSPGPDLDGPGQATRC